MMFTRCSSSPPLLLPLFAALALTACGSDQAAPDNEAAPPAPAAANVAQAVPTPVPDLDRESLLLAVSRAASAFAAGQDDTRQQSEFDNRKFAFRIRFGCAPGEPGSESDMTWSHDEPGQTLRVKAAANIGKDDPLVQLIFGQANESVEGFWVPRPWLLTDACPNPGGAPMEAVPSSSVGLVQLFTETGSRLPRRSQRSYDTVKKIAPEEVPTEGLNLVLRGRLSAGPDKRVISCTAPGPHVRPTCLVAVEFDQVAVENPANGNTIAEWGVG